MGNKITSAFISNAVEKIWMKEEEEEKSEEKKLSPCATNAHPLNPPWRTVRMLNVVWRAIQTHWIHHAYRENWLPVLKCVLQSHSIFYCFWFFFSLFKIGSISQWILIGWKGPHAISNTFVPFCSILFHCIDMCL